MLETPYVFIDTQVFVASGFNYDSGRLAHAHKLASQGRIRLLSTDVTHGEIVSNIKEALAAATGNVQKFRQKHRVLATSLTPSFDAIFKDYDEAAIGAHLADRLSDFEKNTATSILSVNTASTDEVFRKYFEKLPPFSEKKKSEFPDAFVLQTLKEWCRNQGAKIYVVSDDPDMQATIKGSPCLLHLPSLEILFEIVATEDEELGDIARTLVEACLPDVTRIAAQQFESLGFYLEDQEGDVDSVVVDNVKGEELHVVEIEGNKIHFVWEVTITFTADVIYEDMETAVYDSEDKVAYAWRDIETTIERAEDLSVNGEVTFNRWPPHEPNVDVVRLETASDIGITVVEWDYK